jgi:hypothetical protein
MIHDFLMYILFTALWSFRVFATCKNYRVRPVLLHVKWVLHVGYLSRSKSKMAMKLLSHKTKTISRALMASHIVPSIYISANTLTIHPQRNRQGLTSKHLPHLEIAHNNAYPLIPEAQHQPRRPAYVSRYPLSKPDWHSVKLHSGPRTCAFVRLSNRLTQKANTLTG